MGGKREGDEKKGEGRVSAKEAMQGKAAGLVWLRRICPRYVSWGIVCLLLLKIQPSSALWLGVIQPPLLSHTLPLAATTLPQQLRLKAHQHTTRPGPHRPTTHCVDEGQDLLCVFEQQVVVDLGCKAQQVAQGEVLVDGALNGTELVKYGLIGDAGGA